MQLNIKFIYPVGNLLEPTTGGEFYDNKLYNEFKKYKNCQINIIEELKGASKFKILFNLLKLAKLSNKTNDIYIFNTRISPYILPFLIYNYIFGNNRIFGIHHHFAYEEKTGLARWLMNFIERLSIRLCTQVISPNPYIIDCIKNLVKGTNPRFIGHPFVHTKKKISNYQKYNLLYVGTIYPRKGIEYLISAIGLLPIKLRSKINLNIVGNCPDENYLFKLNKLITNLGLSSNIIFNGRVSQNTLIKFYESAYCFVLPSKHEGYGLVIEEAMAYGLPVIAFNNSAMPYTIKHNKNGMLVKNLDFTELSMAIKKVIEDENFHHQLSQGAVESYSQTHDVTDFEIELKKFMDTLM